MPVANKVTKLYIDDIGTSHSTAFAAYSANLQRIKWKKDIEK